MSLVPEHVVFEEEYWNSISRHVEKNWDEQCDV